MAAEEYLNEYCKSEDWNNLEECLKDSILTNNVIEHMERYARYCLTNFAEWLEEEGYPIPDRKLQEYLKYGQPV